MAYKRSALEVVLGGALGAALGGIITVSLLLSGTSGWITWIPIVVGAVAGFWKGDRALHGLIRMLEFLS